ncbi:uncharacterized protein LOC121963642, partial [Plectropomus leopardus]|uniref:uncharacterized protein LOC121963642 n=1 Tax=Plectropomus leopardus TaxID=160734 RepID=UPI001C4A7749
MLFVDVFCFGALMLCCSGLCVALQVSHEQQLIPTHDPTVTEHTSPSAGASSASTGFHRAPHNAPCFVDDIFAVLREGVGSGGELTNRSLAQFGLCSRSDSSSSSVLLQLAKETSRNGLEVLHPAGVLLAEEDATGTLILTFDLSHAPLLKLNPVLLLAFESPLTGQNLEVTFTSQLLHPSTQAACISGETRYILLTGQVTEGDVQQNWRISVETKLPDMNQILKDILIGGKPGSNISMTPLLLFSGDRGTDT